jgi:two-component system response regulator HydG
MTDNTRTILVLDDDIDLAEALCDALSEQGYAVEVSTSPREAIERLRAGPLPNLLLLDFLMPELDGADVLDALDHCGISLPTVVFSAAVRESRVLERRVAALLRKPCAPPVLFDVIDRVIERSLCERASRLDPRWIRGHAEGPRDPRAGADRRSGELGTKLVLPLSLCPPRQVKTVPELELRMAGGELLAG